MKSVTMQQIGLAREVVSLLILQKQKGDRAEVVLEQIKSLEGEIDSLLVCYHSQPDCPFCRLGKMLTTPTTGRLSCERCQAITLIGRQ